MQGGSGTELTALTEEPGSGFRPPLQRQSSSLTAWGAESAGVLCVECASQALAAHKKRQEASTPISRRHTQIRTNGILKRPEM